jgi:hypothetical protein
MNWPWILVGLAFVCFIVSALRGPLKMTISLDLTALGLAFFALSLLVRS